MASLELAQLLRGESLRLAGGQGGGIRYGAHHAHACDFFTVRNHIMIFVILVFTIFLRYKSRFMSCCMLVDAWMLWADSRRYLSWIFKKCLYVLFVVRFTVICMGLIILISLVKIVGRFCVCLKKDLVSGK